MYKKVESIKMDRLKFSPEKTYESAPYESAQHPYIIKNRLVPFYSQNFKKKLQPEIRENKYQKVQ